MTEPAPSDVTESDGLFLRDQSTLVPLAVFEIAGLTLASFVGHFQFHPIDGLLLGENQLEQVFPLRWDASDGLLIGDRSERSQEATLSEALILESRALRAIDALLRDAILLGEEAVSPLDKTIREAVLLDDRLLETADHAQRIGLLLADARSLGREDRELDAVLLGSRDRRATDVLAREGLELLDELIAKELLALLRFGLLIGDSADPQKSREPTRTVTDGLFLASRLLTAREHGLRDTFLIGETEQAQNEFTEGLLILDLARTQVLRTVIAADGAFLLDRVLSLREARLRDALLMLDRLRRGEDIAAEERLALGEKDARVSELPRREGIVLDESDGREAALLQRDAALIAERLLAEREHTADREGVFMRDAALLSRLLEAVLSDGVLTADRSGSERAAGLGFTDGVEFAEVIARVREILASQGLFLDEDSVAALTVTVLEFLAFAELETDSILGDVDLDWE